MLYGRKIPGMFHEMDIKNGGGGLLESKVSLGRIEKIDDVMKMWRHLEESCPHYNK